MNRQHIGPRPQKADGIGNVDAFRHLGRVIWVHAAGDGIPLGIARAVAPGHLGAVEVRDEAVVVSYLEHQARVTRIGHRERDANKATSIHLVHLGADIRLDE